jgi:osmotically-inducible protein OsmY
MKLLQQAVALLQKFNAETSSTYSATTLEEFRARTIRGERLEGIPSPTEPGTSAEDLRITHQIRQALTSNRALSTDAQNVKIITRSGAVTLLGQVKNADEKSVLALAAQRTAGVKSVDDQLQLAVK